MRQEISAFMDGELFEDEADNLLDNIKRDSKSSQDWETYHLIGDILRQPENISFTLAQGSFIDQVRKNLQDEPIIIAHRGQVVKQKARAIALSAAASLLAVGMVVWMSLQINPVSAPQIAMQQNPSRPASVQIRSKSNDYLMAHQEFSPSTVMNGGASYIHTVSYGSDEK